MRTRLTTTHAINIFISFVIATVLFLIIDPDPDPFKVEYDFIESRMVPMRELVFADLDNDGIDEKIVSHYDSENGYIICQAFNHKGGIIDQYNLTSDEIGVVVPRFGDFDHDGIEEIYFLCKRGMNLYIRQILPYAEEANNISEEIFLDSMICTDENPNFSHSNFLFIDKNLDGFDEIYLSIFGTYRTHYPRKMYAVDWREMDVISESQQYGNMSEKLVKADFDKDGVVEITGSMASSANNDKLDRYPYHDHNTYYMVFDLDLKLKTKPVVFNDEYTYFALINNHSDIHQLLTGIYYNKGRIDHKPYVFQTRSYSQLDKKEFLPVENSSMRLSASWLRSNKGDRIVVTHPRQGLLFYNDSLELLREVKFGFEIYPGSRVLRGMNHLEEMVIVGFEKDQSHGFYSSEGKLLCHHSFNDFVENPRLFGYTSYYNQGSHYLLRANGILFFSFYKNVWYHLQWLLFLLLVAGGFIIVGLIRWSQNRQLKIRENLKAQMRRLELVGIKNQLDPHFTFNALNVLNYLSRQNDTEGVESFTNHFSKLLRRQVALSDQPYTTLHDEIRFIEHYIELQKLRFDAPIKYDLDIDQQTNMNLRIPKMMIHTHVENAIKHGIIPAQGGLVKITIYPDRKSTLVIISDDGVGRKFHSQRKTHTQTNGTGKGLKVLDQLFDLYNQLYNVKISQEFIDLLDDKGESRGTSVRIRIPS